MIELRWLKREKIRKHARGPSVTMGFDRILQYRIDPFGLGHWNDWQDVLDVNEHQTFAAQQTVSKEK